MDYQIGYSYDDIVDPDYRVQESSTGSSYLSWYIRTGSVHLKINERSYSLKPRDWIFFEPMTPKFHRFDPGSHLVSIRFSLTGHPLRILPPLTQPILYRETKSLPLLKAAERFCSFEKTSDDGFRDAPPSVETLRKAYFYKWLHQWHSVREEHGEEQSISIDNRFYEIISVLRERIGIAPVDYEHLRTSVGLSRAQIDRIFKEATNITPKQWRDTECLKAAEEWLRDDKLSVKEIAAKLDFFDPSHFTKWFRSKMGMTPTNWRRSPS